VSTAQFSVKVNGALVEQFQPSRGLRQGDPVSPYLFLACAEGLTALLHHYNSHVDRGVLVCNRAPWVSHLLFADDSLIFINANSVSARRLDDILQIYNNASGQRVNKAKSAVFFSPCTPADQRTEVKQILDIHVEAFTEKYLGLPTAAGRLTSEAFEYIADRSRNKVGGYAERNMSYAAKETLIKSVLQAQTTFSMSCFQLSKGTCKTITSVWAKFWWSGNLDKRSMHWLSWQKLSVPKSQGGMGFRDLEAFNIALLGKQAWRMVMYPDSLCAQVLRSRYFPNRSFMEATAPRAASKTWRAILAGREALKLGLIKRIGSGESVSIWDDDWIPGPYSMKPMGKLQDTTLLTVNELMNEDHQWNVSLVRELFFAPDADAILKIPLRRSGGRTG
jgi:hypothetical protein